MALLVSDNELNKEAVKDNLKLLSVKLNAFFEEDNNLFIIKNSEFNIDISFKSEKVLLFRMGGGHYSEWIEYLIRSELGDKLNLMSAEEYEDVKWKSIPDKYPTFLSWINKHNLFMANGMYDNIDR